MIFVGLASGCFKVLAKQPLALGQKNTVLNTTKYSDRPTLMEMGSNCPIGTQHIFNLVFS